MYIDTNVQLAIAAARQLGEKGGLRVHILVPDQTEFNRSYKMCGLLILSTLAVPSRMVECKLPKQQSLLLASVDSKRSTADYNVRLYAGFLVKRLQSCCSCHLLVHTQSIELVEGLYGLAGRRARLICWRACPWGTSRRSGAAFSVASLAAVAAQAAPVRSRRRRRGQTYSWPLTRRRWSCRHGKLLEQWFIDSMIWQCDHQL